eukprot:CAMPEP_0185855340 /NCGR_PEP_ID=MMETSP1354-20130828/25363_1 /TAXON_ID=708628 /ORGANISM="Erythrolobus madagascarensis, Strain CCMP3276" /LENGTH=60 /DNA_ID=CAMNT_0028557343 /DNA_START=15 /DNA_END=197 /DNA_ORIENTATION=-
MSSDQFKSAVPARDELLLVAASSGSSCCVAAAPDSALVIDNGCKPPAYETPIEGRRNRRH